MKIEDLVDVPEEEYSVYLKDYSAEGKSYGSDIPRDADYRYQTDQNNVPKSKFFGKVKSMTGRDKDSTWASGMARAVGRTLVSAGPSAYRALKRVGQESIVQPALNLYDMSGWYLLDSEMDDYKKSVGFDNMTPTDKVNFMKTDAKYHDIQKRMNEKSQSISMREDPKFEQITNELYGNLKKAQQEFISKIGLEEKETDPRLLVELSEGAGSLIEAAAIVAITKNPTAAAYVFGVQQGSGLYEEARENGVDVAPALGIATAGGTVEGVLEKWGLHKLAENITTKTLARAAGKSFLTEAIQEGSQQTAEEAIMYKIRNDEGLKDKVVRIAKSTIYGGILGSMGSVVSRPFVLQHAKDVHNELVQNGVEEGRATELVNQAINGTESQKESASHDIQVALSSAQFQQIGFTQEESESLAENLSITNQDFKDEVIESLSAELDPITYEGGTVEGGVKFFDENINKGVLTEDFDIAEDVKKEAVEGGMNEEQANLLSTAVDAFAKTMYNKTGITPREAWEDEGALHLMIKDERPNVEDMEDEDIEKASPEERKVWDDGSYEGEDGFIHDKDGKILFQPAYAGSRVDYDKPSLEAIGSGEGHQVHGWGLYYALSKDVADGYRKRFSTEEISFHGKRILSSPDAGSDYWVFYNIRTKGFEKTKEYYQDAVNTFKEGIKNFPKEKEALTKDLKSFQKGLNRILSLSDEDIKELSKEAGQLHEVDIPENPVLLDEQKKFSEQSDFVKERLKELAKDNEELSKSIQSDTAIGRDFYTKIGVDLASGIKDIDKAISDAPRLASEKLRSVGIKGITYFGREDGRCFVIFNPDDVKVIQKFYQGEEQAPRAVYKHSLNEKILEIFKNGDASSIVHELGHYFTINYLEALQRAGQEEEAREILNWLGVASIDELLGDSPKATEALEKLARGFETYVMTSEAPTSRLKEFFERFKNWMLKIYESIVPEQINDDVRAFFDKMLAADEVNVAEVMRLADNKQALREVVQQALSGKAVEIGGIKIDDVKHLVKALNARVPKKVKTLRDYLKEIGINEEFAKKFDLDYSLGVADLLKDDETLKDLKKRKLITQKQINEARKLITKDGGIEREDELIDWLHSFGFLQGERETYGDTSELWDEALNLLANAENVYTPDEEVKAEERQAVLDAITSAEQALSGIDYNALLSAIKTLAKNETVGVQKETLKYIKEKQKEIDKGYKKLLKQMLKAQKKDLQSVRDAVVDFIREQPILEEDKTKLMGFIKKANSMNTLQKISEQIRNKAMEYYDKEQRKELNRAIQKEIRQTKPYTGGEQRYDYENNKLFQELRKYNRMTREKAGEELAKLPMDEEAMSDLTETDLIKRRFLSYKAGGADASQELMTQVLKDILDAKEKGKQAKNEEEHEKMVNMENDRQELIKVLDESKADPKKLSDIIQNKYRTWITSLYSMLNSIFGKNIADKYQLEVKQTDVNARVWQKTTDAIRNIAKIMNVKGRTGVIDAFTDMAQKKYTITDAEGLNKEIDVFGIIDIYNAIKNTKTKQDYYNAFGEEQVNGLVNTLTVQERALGDYLMQEVNGYYNKLNDVYVKLYGIDLPRVENYWPATSEHKDSVDIQGDYFQQTTIPSALKERSRGKVIPIPKNAWQKFNKHIAEAEYISGLGLDYMNIKKIFKSRRIKSKLQEKYGEPVYKAIMSDIESLSMASKIQEIDEVNNTFQKILGNTVLAKIAIGIPVFVKQLTSCTNYAVDMPVKLWARDFAAGLAHPKETVKFMMDNAPFLKARFGQGYNEALARVIRDASKMSGKKVRWTEAMSSFTRYGDIGAIIFGGYPYLKYLKNTGVENAVEKFEFSTLRSQQSGTPVSLSPFQRSRGMMQIFQAFNNTPMQYMRMIYDAVYQYRNGDITAQQMGKQLFNFGIIQPALYVLADIYAKKMINWNDDDEDDNTIAQIVKQIVLNPIDGLPVFSDFIDAIIDRAIGNKNYGLKPVLWSDIEKSMIKLNKKELDAWDVAEIITPIVEGTTAAPMSRVERILKKNFKD